MKHTRYIVFLAFLSLLAAFSCQRGELDIQDPHEGQEEVVLTVCDPQAVRLGTRAEVEPVSIEYGPFTVTAEEWPLEAPTRVTEVTTVAGSTVAWGAYNNTAGTLWNVTTATPAAVSGSSTVSTVNTGRYTSATGGPSVTYYMANVNNSSTGTLSVTSSNATVTVNRYSATAGVDLVAGTATSSSPSVNLNLSHAYARTGTVTLNVPAGMTLSSSYWSIKRRNQSGGHSGTYNINSGTWSSATGMESYVSLTTSSDYYLIPGDYDVRLNYYVTLGDGTYKSETLTTEGGNPVTLEKGKKNNIEATIPDDIKHELYIAWASSSGVVSGYQEVPAHGDIYVGGHATLQARLYTIRNGVLDIDTYDVISNSQVTWSIPYDYSYISIDPSTGVLTGLSPHGTAGTYDSNSCYIHAECTVDGQTYRANNNSKRALVNVLPSPVSTTYRLAVTPNPGTLNVGRYGTYQVYRQELENGVYSGNQVQIPNTDVTWSVQDTGIATVVGTGANAGRATGVAPGTTTVTVTLKSTAQYYSDYTSAGRTATATLNVVTSGGIDPGWTDPGSEIIL